MASFQMTRRLGFWAMRKHLTRKQFRSESIVLQLNQGRRVVKRFADEPDGHRLDAGTTPNFSIGLQ